MSIEEITAKLEAALSAWFDEECAKSRAEREENGKRLEANVKAMFDKLNERLKKEPPKEEP